MQTRLNIDQEALSAFCSHNGNKRLSLFGSQLTGTAGSDSDIDLLVEFEEGKKPGLIGIAGMEEELSALLGNQRVDLRTAEDLSRYFRDEVVSEAEVLHSELSEEDYQFIEGVSQDVLFELWEGEEENVWRDS